MGDFLRKLAALSICVTLAGMILPEGDTRRVARLALALLMTLLMTSALMELLAAARLAPHAREAGALLDSALTDYDARADERYRRATLTAWANQLAERCERFCKSAGYAVEATAYLQEDGSAHHITLRLLRREETPLYDPAQLPGRLCEALSLDSGQVTWEELAP